MGLFDGFGSQMGNLAAPLMQMQQQGTQTSAPMDGTNLTALAQMPMSFGGLPQIMQPSQGNPAMPSQGNPVLPAQGNPALPLQGNPASQGVGLGVGTFANNGAAPAQPADDNAAGAAANAAP